MTRYRTLKLPEVGFQIFDAVTHLGIPILAVTDRAMAEARRLLEDHRRRRGVGANRPTRAYHPEDELKNLAGGNRVRALSALGERPVDGVRLASRRPDPPRARLLPWRVRGRPASFAAHQARQHPVLCWHRRGDRPDRLANGWHSRRFPASSARWL